MSFSLTMTEEAMRRLLAGTLSGATLFVVAASPATAAPSASACDNGPHGTSHGTVYAHHTVPDDNHQAHQSIPQFCSYPD